MPPLNDLRKRMKPTRIERELTLQNVANATGLSISYLSDIERGRNKTTLNTLDNVFDYLGINWETPMTPDETTIIELWNNRRHKELIIFILNAMD